MTLLIPPRTDAHARVLTSFKRGDRTPRRDDYLTLAVRRGARMELGQLVEYLDPRMFIPQIGRQYVVFVGPSPQSGVYALMSGANSIFDVSSVMVTGSGTDGVSRQLRDTLSQALRKELEALGEVR